MMIEHLTSTIRILQTTPTSNWRAAQKVRLQGVEGATVESHFRRDESEAEGAAGRRIADIGWKRHRSILARLNNGDVVQARGTAELPTVAIPSLAAGV
jgi:hypothetical protein